MQNYSHYKHDTRAPSCPNCYLFRAQFFFCTLKRTFQFFAVSFIHNLHFICLCADNTRIQDFAILYNNRSVNRTTAIRHFYSSALLVGIIAICCRFTIHCSRQRSWRVEDTQLIGAIHRHPANSTLARRDNISARLALTSLRKVDNCVLGSIVWIVSIVFIERSLAVSSRHNIENHSVWTLGNIHYRLWIIRYNGTLAEKVRYLFFSV